MITAPHLSALSADRVAATGHCPVCAAVGRAVLAAPGRDRCTVHLARPALLVETTRTGQTRLVAPAGARRRPFYPTGVQIPCVPCAAAGVDRQGLPRDGDDSDPLCMSCWRAHTDRAQRHAAAELRAAALDVVDDIDQDCAACGAPEPSPACWLCGYSWLAAAAADFAAEQAAEATAVQVRFALLSECTEAEARVAELTGWVDRLRATIEAFATGGRRGRAVELLADLLCRDAAARSSKRGRPSVLAAVAGVLAVDAIARITRPGRLRTAELAGCAPRTVTDCWARAEALEWMVRTVQGRRLSLDERTALGRTYDRAEFDLAHLGGRDRAAARAPYLPVALLVLDELLQHALTLLQAAHDDVDTLHARSGATMDMAAMARRAQLRQAAAQARETALSGAEHLANHALNICHPRAASIGMSVYSCWSRGFGCPPSNVHPSRGSRRTRRREERASRSPIRNGAANRDSARSQHEGHPRPLQKACDAPRTPRRAPKWAGWAYELARTVQARWTWLRPAPLPRVAATLGAALGPDWTAATLDTWVHRSRARSLLADPRDPVAYLRAVLEDAFTSPAAPPHPARRHVEHRRQVALDVAGTAAGELATTRAQWDARDQAARAERAGRGSGRNAALAAARAAARGDHATARAISAAAECDWPEVAQPGGGLPPGVRA